jgi:mRNA interferase MazF
MGITKGDIVLVEFPLTDLSQIKLRPAIVLAVNLAIDEITLCFISSQQVDRVNASEFALLDSDPDFPQTGLRISSKVRALVIVEMNPTVLSRF